MNRFSSIKAIFALVLSLFISACGGQVEVEEEDQQNCGKIPQSTLDLQEEIKQAYDQAMEEYLVCDDAYQDHLKECAVQGEGDELSCPSLYGYEANICTYNYAQSVNAPTEEKCGAQWINLSEGTNPKEFVSNPSLEDTDNDGVSNSDEIQAGSDPCSPNSLDPCLNDGDFDFDEDGILNAEDPAPFCPGEEVTTSCI